MKISIIYGTNPTEILYNQVHLLLKKLAINSEIKVKEFFISKDIPLRSTFDYYSFFYDEQIYSDYYKSLNRISYYLNKSDIIIFVPSTDSKSANQEIKNLLNHLSYKWMPHKKNHNMNTTIAIMITSSSCFSFELNNLFFCKNFRFWGINKRSMFIKNFYKNSSNTIPIKKIKKINSEVSSLAVKILNQYEKTCTYLPDNHKDGKTIKDKNKKKALIFSKCLSTLKKVVHA